MTQIKKFGLGGLVAALFATMAFATLVNTAYANVTDLTVSTTVLEAGSTAEVTADLGATLGADDTFDGTNVTFRIQGSSSASGEWQNGEQELLCTLTVDGSGDITAVDCDGDAPAGGFTDSTVTVELTADGDSSDGTLSLVALHNNNGDNASISVVGGSGDVDQLTSEAPLSVLIDQQDVVIDIYAVDGDGDAVSGEVITAADVRGAADIDGDTATTNANGRARFTFDVDNDDDLTGVVITFYTGGGSIVAGDKSVTVSMAVPGDAASIEVEVGDVAAGGTSTVTATVLDEDDNPVPDAAIDFDASFGSVLACDDETDGDGVAECTYVAPTSTGVAQITAVSAGAVGTATVSVSASTPTPGGDGTFVAPPVFGANGVGSAVFNGGTIEQLSAAVTAAGGTAVWVQGDDGNWYRYNTLATGATAFVNNAFIAEFAAGLGTTAVFVVE